MEKRFTVEVEPSKPGKDGKPSVGPVYRSSFAKDGFPQPIPGLDTCWNSFCLSVEKYPNNKMLGRREIVNGKPHSYSWMTYKEVYDVVLKVGNSICSCGLAKGGRCGIYGVNSPEWIICMEACNAHALYCVPLYDTLGAGAVEFIICHAEVAITFVEEKKISELLKAFPGTTKYLKTIISFGKYTCQQKEECENFGVAIYSWNEFLSLGENKQFNLPLKEKNDICTIMYTSGATGDPKGVMISNNSIVSSITGVKHTLDNLNESVTVNDVYLSYLPLAHIYDRVMEEVMISQGASIGFWRGDPKLLMEDIAELQPSIFSAVPRIFDRIYSGLQQKISSGGFIKKTAFKLAYSMKLRNMRTGFKHAEASPISDKLVFNMVKQGLGGNVRVITSGAAPLAPHVEEFLRVVSCSYVLPGYGLTETCAVTCFSLPDNMSMMGTVGPPMPSVDVCLESVPELGYNALARIPRGEICVRGNTLFSGYYKSKELTEEVLIDGWFHTGDIGEWQNNGCLKIIDRKKNIFKLSQGEYVAVEHLETIYGLVPSIDSIWVYGNSFESFLIAVINPNKQAVEQWAEQNCPFENFNDLCKNPNLKDYFLQELKRIAKEKKLKGFEYIKAVHIDPAPFDMDRNLITPTYKLKRPQLLKYYQVAIDEMYKSAK